MLAMCRLTGSFGLSMTRPFMTSTPLATTILSVMKDNEVVMMGDGQATFGTTVMKSSIKKVRRLQNCLVGFAGSTADAMTLLETLESKMDEHPGNLLKSCVEMSKMWRTNKMLSKLEATLLVTDGDKQLMLMGNGDLIEHGEGDSVMATGSGGNFALAAAKVLLPLDLNAKQIAERSMEVATAMDIYSNNTFSSETLGQEFSNKDDECLV